jgi:hypothetical protein
MTTTVADVSTRAFTRMKPDELDQQFRAGAPAPIPAGKSRGTAIIFPGSAITGALAVLARMLFWKGKVFSTRTGDLKNRLGPFGLLGIRAKVYQDQSWFDKRPAIILDYSKTSFLAQKIRDEIRQVAPGVYLGQVFWGKRRIALFSLEFPSGTST